MIENYRNQIRDLAIAEIEGWRPGATMAMRPRMQAVTLEVILRPVFGIEDAERLDRLRVLLPRHLEEAASLFWLPEERRADWLPPMRRLYRSRDEITASSSTGAADAS